jgi:hypothetical protein
MELARVVVESAQPPRFRLSQEVSRWPAPVGSRSIGRSAQLIAATSISSTMVSWPYQASRVSHHSPDPMAGCGMIPVAPRC